VTNENLHSQSGFQTISYYLGHAKLFIMTLMIVIIIMAASG